MSEKRYTEEQFNRLPKWAQKEISGQERHVVNLKAHIAELNGKHPDSNVQLGNYVYGDCNLPPDSAVGFYLGEPPYRKYRNLIEVQILGTRDRKVLRVAGQDGCLVIKPSSSNAIEVGMTNR